MHHKLPRNPYTFLRHFRNKLTSKAFYAIFTKRRNLIMLLFFEQPLDQKEEIEETLVSVRKRIKGSYPSAQKAKGITDKNEVFGPKAEPPFFTKPRDKVNKALVQPGKKVRDSYMCRTYEKDRRIIIRIGRQRGE